MSNSQEPIVLVGPQAIAYARLSSVKGMLKLESIGLRSRAGALRPRLAKEFGLSPRAPYADYINYCITKMDEMLAERQRQVAAGEADPCNKVQYPSA